MTTAYDKYDYPSYWTNRKYEHESEVIVLREFLKQIPKIRTILEIGGGFGRLTPIYSFRAKKVILSDPSAKSLKIASRSLGKNKKIKYLQAGIGTLPRKIKRGSIDLIILIRVLHHLENLDKTFSIVNGLLKKRGYFILEFANKSHFKANVAEFLKGNFTFRIDIFPKDLRKKPNKKNNLPFFNYHPDIIVQKLSELNLDILEKRSVSNFRNAFFKNSIKTKTLLMLEEKLQRPLSCLSFGPSIFLLCQKKE